MTQTHISYLFFQGDNVYKIKKTIKTDFLDYSQLDIRRQKCFDELRLNRRLAPHIYRGVRAVYFHISGGLSWQQQENLCDWVVHMLRLPADRMLDYLMIKDRVSTVDLMPVVKLLSDFYSKHRVSLEDMDDFWMHLYFRSRDNFSFTTDNVDTIDLEKMIDITKARQLSFLFSNYKQIMNRSSYIVDAHGDLKPEHICLISPPVIFDCIEFDRHYRIMDIIDELCFFQLECQMCHRKDLGDFVFQSVSGKGNYHPLLASFYLSYRAMVRAKVEHLKSQFEKKHALSLCRRYLELAFEYATNLAVPSIVFVGGLSGSGKTTVAEMIASMLHAKHIQSDEIRDELYLRKIPGMNAYNKGRYLPEKKDLVYEELIKRAQRNLMQGYNVVVDASFISKRHRSLAKILAKEYKGLNIAGIWCTCNDRIAIERLVDRSRKPSNRSEAGPEIFWKQKQALDRIEKNDMFRHQVDTNLELSDLNSRLFSTLKKQLSL